MKTSARRQLKSSCRSKGLALRRSMPDSIIRVKSGIILKRLLNLDQWKAAHTVWCYVSLPDEVQTFHILRAAWAQGKETAVPKVTEDGLVFGTIRSFSELEEGCFHVMEPKQIVPSTDPEALILLPGAAFDEEGNRIGYGGGYYDRFLEKHPGHPTVALAFDVTVFPSVPKEENDIRPDLIITEMRSIDGQLRK